MATELKAETSDRSILVRHGQIHRFWRTAGECLAGAAAVILVTIFCFKLRLDLPMPTCLYMMVIVLVSARTSLLSAAIISVVATGCMDYYFLPPLFSFELHRPTDYVALVAFLTTSIVITHLVAHVRVLTTDKLHRSEAYSSEAQRLSHTGSFGWRVSTGKLIWSEETFRIFQYDPATKPTVELVLQRVHPDDAARVKETIARAQDGGDFDLEHRLLMPDGSVKHVRVVAHAERADSGELEFVGAVMDVTAAKEAEDKIRLTINAVPGLLWTARPDGWVDFLNQRWLDYTGMTLEQGLGWAWQPGYHPDDLGHVLSKWRAAIAQGKPLEVEARLRRFDGEYRWFLKRAFPLVDHAGRVLGWYGGNIDIHDLKQAEEKLRRIETYLSEGQRLSKTGSWVWDAKTKENVFWSKELRRIYGFDPETSIVPDAVARQRVHPDDESTFDQTFQQALLEQRNFEIDHRIILPGGEVKHIHVVGHPVLNGSGQLVEYIGTVLDVTERKRAEMEAQAHLWFLESMDRINRAIQGANDLEEMMSEVLKAVLSIFNCDRAWLVYPCDPEAPKWRAVMQHVRPEFPGAFALGVDLPLDPPVAAVFGRVRGSTGSVSFGPESDDLVPSQLADRFSIRSMIGLAIYPKLDKPYMFGLHQCTHPRGWTLPEQRLFQEIGRRMEDALSALLMFRSLQNSEVKLEEAQRIAHVGYWERDLDTDLITWSNETYRIYGLPPRKGLLNLSQLASWLHPEDRQKMVQAVADAVNGVRFYNVEYRIIRPNGEVRFVHSRGDLVKDESGRPRRHFGTIQDITERKRAEEALHRSENYLAEAQRLSHTGSWARSVATGEITYWSEECRRVVGFNPHQGLPQFETFLRHVHPDDQARVKEASETAARGKVEYEVDYRIVHPNGQIRDIHAIGHPVLNPSGDLVEFVGTVMDVTERKLAEALLSSEKHILELIAGGAALPAVLNDLCSTIDEQSPGLISTVLVLDSDGQRLWPVAGPGIPQGWTRLISPLVIGPGAGVCGTAAYRKERVVVSDVANDPLCADFREAALSYGWKACWSTPLLSTTGLVLGTFAIYCREIRSPGKRDLLLIERATHIAQIAIERDRTQDSLRQAQANLAHATRVTMMGELTASIAHEVNQPLAAVINNANACISLLPDGDPNLEEVREALTEIIDDAERASNVIARVRQLAKNAPVERMPLDFRDVIADVVALARHECATRRVTIHTEIPKEPPLVVGDRVQLQQVMLNLVVNAIDAMNKVEESKRVLFIRGHRETREGRLETLVSVQDAGTGFKPEQMNRLFEAFYTTKPQGMGMGLAISRSIIEAHGGRLWAEANQGPGATFLFSLPAAPEPLGKGGTAAGHAAS
jgi:PAS domain S-box-containing protein